MYNLTHAEWQEKAGSIFFRNQCFIDGKFIDASDGQSSRPLILAMDR